MSYQREREDFIDRMTREGLPLHVSRLLLREATGLNRRAELACSSEAADRDRVPCPAKKGGPCLCDLSAVARTVIERAESEPEYRKAVEADPHSAEAGMLRDGHQKVTRIAVRDWNAERRVEAALPPGFTMDTQGDPRGYVLRVIPPSYAERNAGRDRFNRDTIGVPAGPSGLRF